ncbi:unnamed protein product, partial [Didymodactylos carnosus]
FDHENPNDEWSAMLTFKPIKPFFKEKANIILWYTNSAIDTGEFYSTSGVFEGIMAGIEFDANSVEIILALIDGNDYSQYEDFILRETLPMKNVTGTMSLKLIYTKNNLKVEIYKDDELVYDALRFYNTDVLGDLGKGKHFTITSHYDNVDNNKHFVLQKFNVFSRKEHETYRPRMNLTSNMTQIMK